MNYQEAFSKFTKALNEGFSPDEIGQAPESAPRKIDIQSETLSVSEKLHVGTIAGCPSKKLLDNKDHFPVITQTQAQSSMSRAMQLREVPNWYNGSLDDLRQDVYAGIMRIHPEINLNVRVPADQVVALSDGETSPTLSKTSIKDPNDDRKADMVPSVSRPNLTSADVEKAFANEDNCKAVAGRLMEMVDKQIEHLESAKKVATRLLKSGLKADEFDGLSTYLQEDILRELMGRGVQASSQTEDRRRELLDRMGR